MCAVLCRGLDSLYYCEYLSALVYKIGMLNGSVFGSADPS